MQTFTKLPVRLSILLRPPISIKSSKLLASHDHSLRGLQWQQQRHYFFVSFSMPRPSGNGHGNRPDFTANLLSMGYRSPCSLMARACSTLGANQADQGPTGIVKELHLKMLQSIEAETAPPNVLLWSLVGSCANREDIKLLFQILQDLRRFRLSNLRIHSNFNSHFCLRVAEACARTGVIDFGKKVLWKHNVYGLTPSIGSAHYLLLHAKEHNNTKHMVEIMKMLKKNSLSLQPGTADIVFCICYNTNKWELISKYAKKFIKEGVKLHRIAFGIWMDFAAKKGDTESIWRIEELRSKSTNQHNLATGFSCAKGYLLEHKPKDAANMIHMLNQTLPDKKKSLIPAELQKLVSEWPKEVIKQRKEEDRKVLAISLGEDMQAMIDSLLKMGFEVTVDVQNLSKNQALFA